MINNNENENCILVGKPRNRKIVDIRKKKLRCVFGKNAMEIIHIGSTSIADMKTRPSYDFLVAVNAYPLTQEMEQTLKKNDFVEQKKYYNGDYSVYLKDGNSSYPYYVYVTQKDSFDYWNFIDFRDYLNVNDIRKKKYEEIKLKIASSVSDVEEYLEQKNNITERIAEEARYWKILSKKYTVKKYLKVTPFEKKDSTLYLISCELNTDHVVGKKAETFILADSVDTNVTSVKAIAILIDPSDKSETVVFASKKAIYYQQDIEYVFKDRRDNHQSICVYEKSCGAVVYFMKGSEPLYLLIKNRSQNMGFPKGHVEIFENDIQTAAREVMEETNLQVQFLDGFRESYTYTINFCRQKKVVYFLAKATTGTIQIPKKEILSYSVVNFKNAQKLLTHSNEKKLLKDAHNAIMNYEKNRKAQI